MPHRTRQILYQRRENQVRYIPVDAKRLYSICTMLDQRRRRWADVVQMLYKCFVLAGTACVYYHLFMYYLCSFLRL